MESKIMHIFYGADNLPYKDQPRTVHFPIVGQAFMGASNTTEIRFYIDKIGSIDATYISIAKLPNGKVGTKILTKGYDAQIDENYVSLKLSNFYTQAKGDLYISLNGYEGGVELEYNQETELWEIHGTPTIQATGSVKIAINYATQYVGDGTEETITLQDIYAKFGEKLDKSSPYYFKVIDNIEDINNPIYSDYLHGNEIVYSKSDNGVYRIVELEGTLSATKLPSAVDCLKLDGSTPMQGDLDLANHNISNANTIQSESIETTGMLVDYITAKSGGDISFARPISAGLNKIKNVAEPILGTDVATKSYVDTKAGKIDDVRVNNSSIVSNKVANIELKNNLEDATNNDIASALATKNAVDSVRELAEGKTKSFTVFIAQNPEFDSTEDFISVDTFTDVEGNVINVIDLKMGDTIYTVDSGSQHYLDRFVVATGDTTLGAINADTPDLTNYYKKNENIIPSASGLDIGSGSKVFGTTYTQNLDDGINSISIDELANKKVLYELTYDGTHILNENGDIVGFADIKQLLDDDRNYVYVNDLTNLSMLNFGAYEDDALWFNSRYKIDGENYLVRLIINAQDQIQHDEDIAVNYNNSYTWTAKQIFNGSFETDRYQFDASAIYPKSAEALLSLGTNTNRFNNLYLKGDVYVNENVNFTNWNFKDESATYFKLRLGANDLYNFKNDAFFTVATNGADLGTDGRKWQNLYLSGNISDGTNSVSVAQIGKRLLTIDSQRHLLGKEARQCVGGVQVVSDNYVNLGGGVLLKNPYITGILVSNLIIDIVATGINAQSRPVIHKARLQLKSDDELAVSEANITTFYADTRQHTINVNATTNAGTYHCQFTFNAPSTTTFTTTGTVASYLYGVSPTLRLNASGTYVANGVKYLLTGISTQLNGSQKELVFEFINLTDGSENNISSYGLEIVDTII